MHTRPKTLWASLVSDSESPDSEQIRERLFQAIGGLHGTLSKQEFNQKCHKLAMEWPSLAAAVGDVMVMYSLPVPGPFRHAQNVMKQERTRGKTF